MSTTAQPLSQTPAPMKSEAPEHKSHSSSEQQTKAPSSSFHKDTPPSYAPKDAPPPDSQKPAPSTESQKPPHETPSSHSDAPSHKATPSTSSNDAQKKTTQSSTEGSSPDKQNAAPSSDSQKSDTQKESEATPKRDPNMPKLRDDQMAHPTEIPPQPHPEKMQQMREEQRKNAEQKNIGEQGQDGHREDKEYPEQKHAGRVGYGPNYVAINGPPDIIDKIKGFKDEVKGKILRKPELVEQGHDRITGELKKKQKEKMDHEGPFAQKEDSEKKGEEAKDDSEQSSKPSGRGGARIETHGESKPAHPDHRDSSYAHTSIAERHKSVNVDQRIDV